MVSGSQDTIAAIATPPGKGGVGIVRVSGTNLQHFISGLCGIEVRPREAVLADFLDEDREVIDRGLLLFFPAPNSFTGEDVVEIHGHGGPVVMDTLLQRSLQLGARPAQPGEFSQRAFLNDKIDLTQAEAIADLIDASSRQAAKSAVRSLQGEFSRTINTFVERLTNLRIFIEAAIDFPDEEIDFISDGNVGGQLAVLKQDLSNILKSAQQGVLLGEGMTVVIAGKPNAGKSSLLNALSGRDSAIVTDIAGTTRDVLRESINIDGMPLHIVDTAGLRDSTDIVELEGIRRAWGEIEKADRILFVADATAGLDIQLEDLWPQFFARFSDHAHVSLVFNKVDCLKSQHTDISYDVPVLMLSAKTGEGLPELQAHLKECMGYQFSEEGNFMARRRHLDILDKALIKLEEADEQLRYYSAGELVAEDLRLVQYLLGEITGQVTADDLLGKIFSSFCIGK